MCAESASCAKASNSDCQAKGESGVIELRALSDADDADDFSEDDPEVVKLMIDFLYLHDYEAPAIFIDPDAANADRPRKAFSRLAPSGDCDPIMHAKMYALGSKYQISSLQAIRW